MKTCGALTPSFRDRRSSSKTWTDSGDRRFSTWPRREGHDISRRSHVFDLGSFGAAGLCRKDLRSWTRLLRSRTIGTVFTAYPVPTRPLRGRRSSTSVRRSRVRRRGAEVGGPRRSPFQRCGAAEFSTVGVRIKPHRWHGVRLDMDPGENSPISRTRFLRSRVRDRLTSSWRGLGCAPTRRTPCQRCGPLTRSTSSRRSRFPPCQRSAPRHVRATP